MCSSVEHKLKIAYTNLKLVETEDIRVFSSHETVPY